MEFFKQYHLVPILDYSTRYLKYPVVS